MYFTCIARSHGAPAVPATKEDWEKMRREPWLVEMCRRIEAGEGKLKSKLPIWTPHCARFANNHRSIKDAEMPLQRLMLDFDEKGHSAEILEKALKLQQEGKWSILLVEDSVRRGTHVLIDLPQGMTAEEAQARFSADVGFQADGAVKDVSRCIYMVPEGHTLYVNEEVFFSPQITQIITDKHLPPNSTQNENNMNNLCQSVKSVVKEAYPQTYENIPYARIVETLEEQLGGKPEHGSRNNHIYAMACHLRYICNDDP
ncbi:MAG: hypothetical protein J6D17_01220, partial [Bacteroides sp.]|nr:hypothetical protein [Bacteroides sp.]